MYRHVMVSKRCGHGATYTLPFSIDEETGLVVEREVINTPELVVAYETCQLFRNLGQPSQSDACTLAAPSRERAQRPMPNRVPRGKLL